MTKHSRHEREVRAAEAERMKQIEAAWYASIPADTATAFESDVARTRARGPLPPPPDMAPGTLPNPPRPGRAPKVEKEERGGRQGRR